MTLIARREAISRRELLLIGSTAVAQAAHGAPGSSSHIGPGWASILDFPGADPTGATPSTSALQAAFDASRRVYLPEGLFTVGGDGVRPQSGTELRGAGPGSVLRQLDGLTNQVLNLEGGSPNPALNLRDVILRGFKIQGLVGSLGFSEHQHLLRISGATRILVEDLVFEGYRGDGLYLAGSGRKGDPRHNQDITITKCLFDGVNRDNRNGISVIDCDMLRIESNRFTRSTRPNMPGAIDVEPNKNDWHVIHDIKILNNQFFANGGGGGSICLFFPYVPFKSPPKGISIEGNTIEGAGVDDLDKGIFVKHLGSAGLDQPEHQVVIRDNTVRNTQHGFRVAGLRGVNVEANRFIGTSTSPMVGSANNTSGCIDVTIFRNQFFELASDPTKGGDGLQIFTVANLRVIENTFSNCGRTDGTKGCAITFSGGQSSNVTMRANSIKNDQGRTQKAVIRERNHKLASDSLDVSANHWAGLRSDLPDQ
jgi:hypothetical protein